MASDRPRTPKLPFPGRFPEHKRLQVLSVLETLMAHCNLRGSGDGNAVLQAPSWAPMRWVNGSVLPWRVAITLADAREKLEIWRRYDNDWCPHAAIGNTVPISL